MAWKAETMQLIIQITLTAVLAIVMAGCMTIRKGSTQSVCIQATQPNVLYAEGWLGGDGGASVLMPDGSSVWLFGDSFIGQAGAANRVGSAFVSNSIGISACNGNSWGAMDHYWGLIGTTAKAFFNPYWASGVNFDWPLEGFYSGSNLYVVLQKGLRTGGPGLGFQLTGTDLAIISTNNPMVWTNPAQWTQQIVPINTSSDAYPDAGVILHDGYVYIYTSLSPIGFITPMTVVRAPLNNLSSIASNLQYLSHSQSQYPNSLVWQQAASGWESDAQIVMDDGFSGMSVTWHPAQSEWIAVYIPAFTSQIVMRTAPGAQGYLGPWSAPQPIYTMPEMTPGPLPYEPNNVCYGAFEHIEWATHNSMVVTYDCNSDPSTLLNDMELYHPVPVTIPLQ